LVKGEERRKDKESATAEEKVTKENKVFLSQKKNISKVLRKEGKFKKLLQGEGRGSQKKGKKKVMKILP